MTVASERRVVGSLTLANGATSTANTFGPDVTIPKGTKWAVVEAQATCTAAAGAANADRNFRLNNVTAGTVPFAVSPGNTAGLTTRLSAGGAPLAVIDATAAAITLRAGSTAINQFAGIFILEQLY